MYRDLQGLTLRKANNLDADSIKQVVYDVLIEYGLSPDPLATDQDLNDIEASYFQNGGYFGVIEVNQKIIATFGLYKLDRDTCELRKMYALSSQRGKGLGKKMIEHSIALAKQMGFKRMVLETATPLVEAISLYKKYGFKEYQPDHLSSRCDQAFELLL